MNHLSPRLLTALVLIYTASPLCQLAKMAFTTKLCRLSLPIFLNTHKRKSEGQRGKEAPYLVKSPILHWCAVLSCFYLRIQSYKNTRERDKNSLDFQLHGKECILFKSFNLICWCILFIIDLTIKLINLLLLKAKHVIVWILQIFLCISHSWTVNINKHGRICIKMIMKDAFCFHFQLAKDNIWPLR